MSTENFFAEQCRRIYQTHGELSPKLVLADAENPDSPLHTHFEWDDKQAGEAYRLDQARRIIQRAKIRFEIQQAEKQEEKASIRHARAYRPTRTEDGRPVYEPLSTFADDPIRREILMADLRRQWQTLRRLLLDFEEIMREIASDPEIKKLMD